jgi:phenylalanyl-tRNA synthetase beta chain
MQFPESWLREFCNPPLTTSNWPTLLTMAGLEVEELRAGGAAVSASSWAEILSAEPAPQRRPPARVPGGRRAGQARCRSSAARPTRAPASRCRCALVGAELPPGDDGKPFLIKVGKLRGVESQRHAVLGARTEAVRRPRRPAGTGRRCAPWAPTSASGCKLDDMLFTLKLTPNLAHALSVYGIAREVAALTGAPLKAPAIPRCARSTTSGCR